MFPTARGSVAIRSTTESVRRLLLDGLSSASDTGSDGLAQGFGIRPAETGSAFHWLYWGRCPASRTRDAKRLITALEQHLSIPVSAPEGHLILELSAGVDADGHAFLLPRIGADVARFDRRLREVGATLLDGPCAVVDVTSGELVVGEPTVRLEPQVRQVLLDELGTTSHEATIPPGRYRIDRMLVEDSERSSAAQQLSWFLGALIEPTDERSALGVRDMLVRLRCVAVAMRDVSTVVAAARTMAK